MEADNYAERFKIKDYSCFDEFYKLTSKQVYFAALAILKNRTAAEDVVQETYLAFLQTAERYKSGENILSYLTVIARNKSINVYNKEKRVALLGDEKLERISRADDTATCDDGADAIISLLSDPRDREIVVYHVILGYKFREIAKIMGIALGTVLWRYNKAIALLKEKVGKLYD